MSADFTIDPLRVSDLPWVVALEACSFRRPWSEDGLRDELSTSFAVGLAAREPDGRPLGYVLGRLLFEEGHLLKIAVDPAMRRKGVGARLLAEFEATLERAGAMVAVLEVRVGNAPARWLYERAGWGVIATRRCYYPDGEDGLLMLKRLT